MRNPGAAFPTAVAVAAGISIISQTMTGFKRSSQASDTSLDWPPLGNTKFPGGEKWKRY